MDEMTSPLRLSVGIPTLNQASFLPETIESLLAQTRVPDEIVLSDHGSTDGTPEIIAGYTARHPGLIRSVTPPPNSNLTDQYNFTLSSQTGDWITLLSSDDLALPNFCKTMLRGAARCPEAALVRAGWRNIDAGGEILSHDYLLSVPAIEPAPKNLMSQRNGPKVSFAAFAVRREAYVASGPILQSIESLADWALFVQLAPFGPYVREQEIVSSYRVGHDGNKFRKRIGMWVRDELRMFQQVFPLTAERAGLKDRAWIQAASRDNLRRYLTAASEEFAPQERAALMPDLAPWAESVGEMATLQRFADGGTIEQEFNLGKAVRQVLRPFAHRLVHWHAKR
jgi:glycosyltransferase involved in cell wall biosynthesis